MDGLAVERENGILRITLNRPEAGNVVTPAMAQGLTALFRALREDEETRVVVLRGNGRHFCEGADLRDAAALLRAPAPARAAMVREVAGQVAAPLFLALHQVPQPVLVSTRGHVTGAALQFVAAADLVIAAETSRFSAPQIKQAHTADHGESWHLPRKLGLARALRLCLLGERLDAAQAERYGLVTWVVPDATLEKRTAVIAAQLAATPPVALRGMKALLRQSLHCTAEEQLALEAEMLGLCAAQEDFIEAIRARLEKRQPDFSDA